MSSPIALAVAAHPDDIEFMMSGTLLQLKMAGADIHMWNLLNGCCGTAVHTSEEIIRIRWEEACDSARLAGATMHAPIADDLALYYTPELLARVGAVIRTMKPDIILLPSPQDYMEDHTNVARLVVSAAFTRGMRNFVTDPVQPTWSGETVLYHALPYGLRDGLRKRIHPGQYVDIHTVFDTKCKMLEAHRSQKDWLDSSQGVGSYVAEMEGMAREVGAMSGCFALAEGWRRHSHLGFAGPDTDPLSSLLGPLCWVDAEYEASLV